LILRAGLMGLLLRLVIVLVGLMLSSLLLLVLRLRLWLLISVVDAVLLKLTDGCAVDVCL